MFPNPFQQFKFQPERGNSGALTSVGVDKVEQKIRDYKKYTLVYRESGDITHT